MASVTHERTIGSKGGGLWGMKGKQLPAKIQHVYNDLVEGGKPTGSPTYRLAVGIVQNWAAGHDGKGNKVSAKVQGEAVKAVAEWNKLRAQATGRGKKVKELDGDTLAAVAELTARGVLQEAGKTQARRRTGQYHRPTKIVEKRKKSHEDLMGEIAAAGHAGDGSKDS